MTWGTQKPPAGTACENCAFGAHQTMPEQKLSTEKSENSGHEAK